MSSDATFAVDGINAAVTWWRKAILASGCGKANVGDGMATMMAMLAQGPEVTPEHADAFCAQLAKALREKMAEWPAGGIFVSVDYGPERFLRDVIDALPEKTQDALCGVGALPMKTTMYVSFREGTVVASAGYGVPDKMIWPPASEAT